MRFAGAFVVAFFSPMTVKITLGPKKMCYSHCDGVAVR